MTPTISLEDHLPLPTRFSPVSRRNAGPLPFPAPGRDGRWHLAVEVLDACVDGVRTMVLFVTDEVGAVLAAPTGATIRGARVVQELDTLTAIYGVPSGIVTGRDCLFFERVVHEWAHRNGVEWFYETPFPRSRMRRREPGLN